MCIGVPVSVDPPAALANVAVVDALAFPALGEPANRKAGRSG
jgi:hypothetical protein